MDGYYGLIILRHIGKNNDIDYTIIKIKRFGLQIVKA